MKRGAISISFGLIFSLIIIIAILGVAAYVITYFLGLQKCTEISLFYQNLQDEVNAAWNSEITRDEFVGKLSGGIEAVCFRDGGYIGGDEQYGELVDYGRSGQNMFLYPPEKTCNQVAWKIEHVDLSELGWHCYENGDRGIRIGLEKGSFDNLVKLKR
jgi:hypothetical protein